MSNHCTAHGVIGTCSSCIQRRERIATSMLAGLCAVPLSDGTTVNTPEGRVCDALYYTDALIAELDK